MKFADIPQFTRMPNYNVHVPWDYLEQWINNHANEHGQTLDLSPVYQRGHVWTEEQQVRYVEYVLRGGKSGLDIHFNCPGWMSNHPSQHIELVDGKQRLNAVLRFLHNEIKAFGAYLNEYTDSMRMANVHFNIHVNNLKTQKAVMQWYVDMNSGGTVHTSEEIERVKALIIAEK